jgi:ferredoxin
MTCRVRFAGESHPPVELPPHANLSEHLTVQNSPVLFGCRTGICGTCVVRVDGAIPPPQDEELDTLDHVAPNDPRARLACQLDLTADIVISVE